MSMPLTKALSPSLPSSTERIIIPAPSPFSPFSSSSSSRKFLGTFAGIMDGEVLSILDRIRFRISGSFLSQRLTDGENAMGKELGKHAALGVHMYIGTSPVNCIHTLSLCIS